jgi:hypothetical protein
MVSPIATGIGIGIGILGLRGPWNLQHRLDTRGYLLQAGTFFGAFLFALAGYYLQNPRGVILFDAGSVPSDSGHCLLFDSLL